MTRVYRGLPFGFGDLRLVYEPGHLWFLQALLIFGVVYALFRALAKATSLRPLVVYPGRFPPDAVLLICIVVLTALTFVERLIWPVGKAIFLNFQGGV